MECIPNHIFERIPADADPIQKIMAKYQNKTYAKDDLLWKEDQCRQDDHVDTDRPNDLKQPETISDVKRPCKVDDHEFDEYQPESAREEEARNLFCV